MSSKKPIPARPSRVQTCDDVLDRNRFLIELAQTVVDDQHRLRRIGTERSDRTRARGLLLCERGRDLAVRLMEIRAATEERCRKSRRASDRSEALMAPPVPTRK